MDVLSWHLVFRLGCPWLASKGESGQGDEAASTFVPDFDPFSKTLQWLIIDDLDTWEARELHFKSPLWSSLQYGMHAGITAQASAAEPLIKTAARQAFWHIPKAVLVKLCDHMGLPVEVSWSLFLLLWNMFKQFLPYFSDGGYLAVLQEVGTKAAGCSWHV